MVEETRHRRLTRITERRDFHELVLGSSLGTPGALATARLGRLVLQGIPYDRAWALLTSEEQHAVVEEEAGISGDVSEVP